MSLILDLKTTEILCSIRIILFDKGYDLTKKGRVFNLRDNHDPHLVVLTKYKGFFLFATHTYMQYPIIRNGHIRNRAEFWGKSKKQALGRSNLRNASKNLRNAQCSDFQS